MKSRMPQVAHTLGKTTRRTQPSVVGKMCPASLSIVPPAALAARAVGWVEVADWVAAVALEEASLGWRVALQVAAWDLVTAAAAQATEAVAVATMTMETGAGAARATAAVMAVAERVEAARVTAVARVLARRAAVGVRAAVMAGAVMAGAVMAVGR